MVAELSEKDIEKIKHAMLSGKTIFQTAGEFNIDFELALKMFNELHKEKWKSNLNHENTECIEEYSLIK